MRIKSLRLKLDAQFGKFEIMRFDPANVLNRGIFLQNHRFKFILFFDEIETFGNELWFEIQTFGIVADPLVDVDFFDWFVRQSDIVSRARINQNFAVAVKNRAARCGNRNQTNALVFSSLGIILAFDDLQIIKPYAENRQ